MNPFARPDRLLQRYGITRPEQIDLEALAWLLKAKVRYRSLDGCEAQITGIRDRAIITIDPRFGERRARFSLGHEIGHWQCHKNQNLHCSKDMIGTSKSGKPRQERQADEYSASLLLPSNMVEPIVRSLDRPSFRDINELSDLFQTSRTATALRYVSLDKFYSLLICYGPNGRIWHRASPKWPSRLIPKQQIDPNTNVYDLLFGRGEEAANCALEPASNYFNGNDVAFTEVWAHSVLSGRRRAPSDRTVMTLVLPKNEALIEAGERRDAWN